MPATTWKNGASKREAGDDADDEHHRDRDRVGDDVGQGAAGEDGGAGHRQRAEAVDQALLEVLGEAQRGDEAAEGHRLDDDPGHQEVDVAVAGRADRAAEDVGEEQHEHDRLHREGEQQVGRAGDPQEAAFGQHQRVGDGVAEAAHRSSSAAPSPSSASAAWPVRVRKTSSRVGPPHRHVVDPDPGLVEPAHRLGDRALALADRHPQHPVDQARPLRRDRLQRRRSPPRRRPRTPASRRAARRRPGP